MVLGVPREEYGSIHKTPSTIVEVPSLSSLSALLVMVARAVQSVPMIFGTQTVRRVAMRTNFETFPPLKPFSPLPPFGPGDPCEKPRTIIPARHVQDTLTPSPSSPG